MVKSNPLYMLDTNMCSYIIKGQPAEVREHLLQVPISSVCISVITEAELLRGIVRKPEAKRVAQIVNEFLLCVDILPWDSHVAKTYAQFRTACEREGKSLGAMDMLIAAHSMAANATLVTNDKAFYHMERQLILADWSVKRD